MRIPRPAGDLGDRSADEVCDERRSCKRVTRKKDSNRGAAEALRRGGLDLLEARGLADEITSARRNAESDVETPRRWLLLAADRRCPDAP